MTMIDVQDYYKKLADQSVITPAEIQRLLKSYELAVGLAAYLADCHAATADGLAASAPISAKKRMRSICDIAARGIAGDFDLYRGKKPDLAQARCITTVEELDVQILAQETQAAERADERKAARTKKSSP